MWTLALTLHTFMSDDERNKSAIDFIIVPATFVSKVFSCKVGEWKCDLLSDHIPISVSLVDCLDPNSINSQPIQKVQFEKKKVSGTVTTRNLFGRLIQNHCL